MQEISVPTSFGTLVAAVGGDPYFPEILVFLRGKDGSELMLARVTDQFTSGLEDILRIAVYGDTKVDDYTQRFDLRRDDVISENAMWQ